MKRLGNATDIHAKVICDILLVQVGIGSRELADFFRHFRRHLGTANLSASSCCSPVHGVCNLVQLVDTMGFRKFS